MSQVRFNVQVRFGLIGPNSQHTVQQQKALFTSDSSNPGVLLSFAAYLDLSMCLNPSSSDKHTKSSLCTAILKSLSEVWNNAPPNSPQVRVTW